MALNLVGTSGNATIDADTGISGLPIDFPTWTTGTRPASPTTGVTGFNTTLGYLETWNGTTWVGGLPSQSGNSGKYLTTDGSVATWTNLPPTITNVTPSSFDGNAGQSFAVAGINFYSGCSTVFIGNDSVTTYATTTTRNSSTSLTVVNSVDMPVANEPYTLKVINADGQYTTYSGIDAGGGPSWTTASGSLGSWQEQVSVSTSVTATDPDGGAITYSSGDIGSGSLTWLSLNSSTGAITGTSPDIASDTSYSFSVTATDNAGNTSARSFSVTITAIVAPTISYLVVAGGGGGGYGWTTAPGGGGGAGGYLTNTLTTTFGTTYTVTVGAGGPSGNKDANKHGSNSVFSGSGITTVTSIGGGSGGSYQGLEADTQTGGSGGGGRYYAGGGYGTAGQGNNGGGQGTQGAGGSGGGGAGAVGADSSGNIGGVGGNGLNWLSLGTYYAGGGGGGRYNDTSGSAGGLGGGGAGGTPTNGTANTGGGGGGGGGNSDASSSGGSGVVIIRYADTYAAAASTTGSPTYTVSGGYRTYKFTSSGSITF